jgi:hypothetical protein
MADVARSTCFVNRTTWVSLVPHPQIPEIVQINFAHHYIPVTGTLAEVQQRLLASPEPASLDRREAVRPAPSHAGLIRRAAVLSRDGSFCACRR